ncbi:hypothetical protein GCM10010915_20670 [Microbacterium faecale]|uniref:4-hydroxybenzoate polyprenyltransferase n=1 Tax=Microbacterium faecale TaxID=1804630 RepID=A0A916YC53_9MICO|nr:hypothetical protein [Microbacterium faecale]GGD39779.1 hypothetical protein GCM10010915_20670 [Microbacterium faecale]
MHIASGLAHLAAESEHHGNVALETLPYGIASIVIFGVLALITASYQNVAHRHEKPVQHTDEKH